jgi:heme-degrading monooxygenase HmoA
MGKFYSVRLWQLKPGQNGADLEALAASGYLEMQRWIPGVKRLSLLRAEGEREHEERFLLTTTFESYDAYRSWRQIEEEAPDYWERFAAIAMQWEQMCFLLDEYVGEMVLDTGIDVA